jgi:hypothetical protein
MSTAGFYTAAAGGPIVLQGVTFPAGADTVLRMAIPVLETAMKLLKKHPQVRVRIEGLGDKAKGYFHVQTYPRQERPSLGAYSKFAEATARYSVGRRALLALMQGPYPIVPQDSTAIAVCHGARARQHRTSRQRTGSTRGILVHPNAQDHAPSG